MLRPLCLSSSVSNHRILILSLKITVAITIPQNGSHANKHGQIARNDKTNR